MITFENNFREEIVKAAKDLNMGDLSFSDFDKSRCNYEYWDRTNNGGFRLKEGVKPSNAINDIFVNSNEYATECATAIMIVYYKALLSVFKEDLFNKVFTQIYLRGWDVTEPLLEEVAVLKEVSEILPGDRQYFTNPDISPAFPEWQGENVIVLPDFMYYGHGIGIVTADKIIHALNSRRVVDATQSSYLMDSAGRPNFKKLEDVYNRSILQATTLVWKPFPEPIL